MWGCYVNAVAAALMLSGCVGSKTPASDARLELVRASLKDPESARFTGLRDVDGILCGFVNAKNSFGGYVGPHAFLVSGREVIIEGAATGSDYDRAYAAARLHGECG